jgi:hypothetical protein
MPRPRRVLVSTLLACALTVTLAGLGQAGAVADEPDTGTTRDTDGSKLFLVTLTGPGSSGDRGGVTARAFRESALAAQDATLEAVGAGAPVYRWTTALNGYAVRMTAAQARDLARDPAVATVEPDSVRRLAAAAPGGAATAADYPRLGGAGVVIGLVDSGLWPDSPLFADVRGLGRSARDFRGRCATGSGWADDVCDDKIVGAHWFVDGFGADRVRSGARLSPLDDDGHGTLMASIAAGNAGVSVKVPGQRAGLYAGAAPQARLAVYKACWTAPDPRDDGCSTADLVTAIDRAVADRVDVLNLSADGPTEPQPGVDTVERALLGAAEADVVVVTASGNRGTRAYAAHASPWVTSVGGTTGATRGGAVVAPGLRLAGAMAARTAVRPARLVLGARVASAGATASQSRFCQPGSLDAALVSGRIVVCERGRIGRVDKSEAVARADGVGMVLVNTSRGHATADFHSVPTVHLTKDDGHRLVRWMRHHPGRLVQLRPDGVQRTPERLVAWTSSGDPRGSFVKPDVVATAVGVLGATPPSHLGRRWDLGSGTSVAAARTSGVAAALLSRHDWSAAEVRSAIATTAGDVAGDPSLLRLGAGRTRARPADQPGLVFRLPVADYRAWLDGDLDAAALNTPSVLLQGTGSVTRTVTNVGTRAMYFSSTATGFGRHQVSVTPAAISLASGESTTFTVRVAGGAGPGPLDDGWVTWLGANGNRVRIPVVIVR